MSTEEDTMCPESAEAEDISLGTRPLAQPEIGERHIKRLKLWKILSIMKKTQRFNTELLPRADRKLGVDGHEFSGQRKKRLV